MADVHFVHVKCPLLTSERVDAAAARNATTVTKNAYASIGYSRGAFALGVALALGELDPPPSYLCESCALDRNGCIRC
jgi:cyanuric acid amidohydrolase